MWILWKNPKSPHTWGSFTFLPQIHGRTAKISPTPKCGKPWDKAGQILPLPPLIHILDAFTDSPPYLAVASLLTFGRFSVSRGVCPHREAFIHSFSRVIHKKEKREYFHLFSTALNMGVVRIEIGNRYRQDVIYSPVLRVVTPFAVKYSSKSPTHWQRRSHPTEFPPRP